MITKLFSFFCLIFWNIAVFAADLGQVDVPQLETLQQQQALVIDIRTAKEWQASGIIPQSQPLTFFDENKHYDVAKWLAEVKKLQKNPEQPLILVCRSGHRSAKAGEILTQQLGMKNVYHLSGGISSWIKADKPIDKDCHSIQACK